ncbi:MAG: DUF4292 domain-containing protein [Bacteroidetes bacterium]|nr:DUF4292 domain-containing protein [Bacteroidota bacterium]
MPRLLAALILLTAAGCSGPLVRNAPDVQAPAGFPGHTAEQIAYQLATQAPAIRAFRSEGRLHIESPTISQGVGISIRASLADSLYAKLRGPLSVEVARTLITADSILAHDKLNHKFYYGPLAVMDRYVPGAGEPGLLAKTLLGMIVPTVTESTTVEADSQYYYLSMMDAAGHLRERWTVDPALWRVVRMEERASDGSILTRRTFSSFDVVDDVVLPRHVELSSPTEGITVSIEHQQLTVNPDPLTFPFSRPRDVEFIPLE